MADPKDTPEKDPKEETVVEDVKEVEEKVDESEKDVKETPDETKAQDEKPTEPEDEKETDKDVDEKVEEKVEEEEEFDVDEFKKTTVEEVQKAVMGKIAAGLGLTKEEEAKVKEEGLVPPWEKRGEAKPKSWKENNEYAADLAEWKREQREAGIAKVQEDNEKEAKEVNKKWNDYWDSELKSLEDSEELPVVKDENDPNDPGKRRRISPTLGKTRRS